MSSRPAPRQPARTSAAARTRTAPRTLTATATAAVAATSPAATPDPALDEALERISELAARLWAVRSAHRPVTAGWRRSHLRCAECGQPVPCATLQAAG